MHEEPIERTCQPDTNPTTEDTRGLALTPADLAKFARLPDGSLEVTLQRLGVLNIILPGGRMRLAVAVRRRHKDRTQFECVVGTLEEKVVMDGEKETRRQTLLREFVLNQHGQLVPVPLGVPEDEGKATDATATDATDATAGPKAVKPKAVKPKPKAVKPKAVKPKAKKAKPAKGKR